MRLRTKMIVSMVALQFLVLGATLAFLLGVSSGETVRSSLEAKSAEVRLRAGILGETLRMARTSAEQMEYGLEAARNSGFIDREAVVDLFRRMMEENPQYFAVWGVFEPNAWDGLDAYFADDEAFAPTGRFFPWVYRGDDGGIQVETVMPDDGEETGDYYYVPMRTGKTCFMEPYDEGIEGERVWMTTVSVPMRGKDGELIGVVGIDLSLEFVSELLGTLGKESPDRTVVVSSGGLVIGHQTDQDAPGRDIADVEEPLVADFVRAMTEGTIRSPERFSDRGIDSWIVGASVSLGETNWGLVEIARTSDLLAGLDAVVFAFVLATTVATAVMLAAIVFFARRITSPLGNVAEAFRRVEDGDLALRIPVVSRDEVGALSKRFNVFAMNLGNMLGSIRTLVSEIEGSSVSLEESVRNSKLALSAMGDSLGSANDGIMSHASSVETTRAEVAGISVRLDDLARALEKQRQATEKAASKVEAIIEGVAAFAEASGKVVSEADGLARASEEGKLRIAAVMNRIGGIAGKAKGLAETNGMVAKIAAQTNLLAMNAAIEAAHAGDYGAGFAVVAREIRALAESTHLKSRDVTTLLKDIASSIDDALTEAKVADEEFKGIFSQVDEVRRLEREGFELAESQRSSARSVIEDLEEVRTRADDVDSVKAEMLELAERTGRAMTELARMSERVVAQVGEVTVQAGELDVQGDAVLEQAVEQHRGTTAIMQSLARWRLEAGEDGRDRA